MARMYSRDRGKSGSKRPAQKTAPWVKYKDKEIEEIIVKLAKKGLQSSTIGIALRDQYGIPSVRVSGNRITRMMKKHDAYPRFPEDMLNLMKRAVNLDVHLKKNKKDYTSKRGLELTQSKIRRLGKYYKRTGDIPVDWKWDLEKVKLLVK